MNTVENENPTPPLAKPELSESEKMLHCRQKTNWLLEKIVIRLSWVAVLLGILLFVVFVGVVN